MSKLGSVFMRAPFQIEIKRRILNRHRQIGNQIGSLGSRRVIRGILALAFRCTPTQGKPMLFGDGDLQIVVSEVIFWRGHRYFKI
jgi:hypothetical protein